jgi:2-amino-4-hydroxy-6-hydroxymethyldihydropteridine diphosphokinase
VKTVYIALGSNLGDRARNLEIARGSLEAAGVKIVRTSSVYETEPREMAQQPWFLNQVIEATTQLFPRQLLSALLKIEREMGRKRLTPKGPRVIDLDILLYGEAVVHAGDLEIPHPRLAERRFVLEPLSELAPELRHPVTRRSVREMLEAVKGQLLRRA